MISGKILQKHRLHNSISVILTHFMVRNRQFPKVQIVFVLSSKPQIRFVLPKKNAFVQIFILKKEITFFENPHISLKYLGINPKHHIKTIRKNYKFAKKNDFSFLVFGKLSCPPPQINKIKALLFFSHP